jgi:ABC-2 type transport system ATP-binding protein
LILDEPTDGLDPNQKHEVRTLIRRMGEKKAIVFSTHILEEVEAVCSRAIIIDRGQIVANGTPAELKSKSDVSGALLLRVGGVGAADLKQKLGQLSAVRKVLIMREETARIQARVYPSSSSVNGELARSVADLAFREKWQLEELHTEEGRLDEVFRTITLPETARLQEETK